MYRMAPFSTILNDS